MPLTLTQWHTRCVRALGCVLRCVRGPVATAGAALRAVCVQELGPRFTLKLESLQKGTFDSKGGEFEWLHTNKMDTSRRKFFL